MASEIRVDTVYNESGDNDTGVDLSTNDQIVLKTANTTRLTMNATGQTTIVGEGGSTTTSVQQGLAKMWYNGGLNDQSIADSINVGSLTDTATGNLGINYTNNMNSVNYSGNCMKQAETTNNHCTEYMTNEATSSTRIELLENASAIDATNAHAQVFGDLA